MEKQRLQAQIRFYRSQYQSLLKQYRQDALLGIFTRQTWQEKAQKIVERHINVEQPCSVLFIDVDFFGKINKKYGHWVGDEVLQGLVKSIQQVMRKDSIIGRYGGEEFVILVPGGEIAAKRCADRVLNAARMFDHPELKENITVSIGHTTGVANLKALVLRADAAVCMAKSCGRNCAMIYPISCVQIPN